MPKKAAKPGVAKKKIKFLTKADFESLEKLAAHGKFRPTRSLPLAKLLDPVTRFPVLSAFLHSDVEMRCMILFGPEERDKRLVDIPIDVYNALPFIEVTS